MDKFPAMVGLCFFVYCLAQIYQKWNDRKITNRVMALGRFTIWMVWLLGWFLLVAAPTSASTVESSSAPYNESSDKIRYEELLTLFRDGDLEGARQGFAAFYSEYPNSDLAPKARFWLGESYYGMKKYNRAIAEYERVILDFPESEKVPVAILKKGYAYLAMKDKKRASLAFKQVVAQYPGTPEAGKASDTLAQLVVPYGRAQPKMKDAKEAATPIALTKGDTVSCKYKYVLGDNDTKHDGRKIAFIEAKRRCAEQIGTLLASETVVASSDLTKDEIRAYSLGFMKTEQVSESFLSSGESLAVLVELKAQYDSEMMTTRLKELLSDRGKSQEFKNAQEQILELEKQVVNSQRQLGETKPDEQILRLREERTAALSQYDTIVKSLENLNTKTRQYARCGMTVSEVQSVLGPPRGINDRMKFYGIEMWNYGEKWIKFQGGVAVAISGISSPTTGDGIGCKTN